MEIQKLTKNSLWPLEHYARVRDKFRKEMIEHKKSRMVSLGENLTLHFEDAQTIKYQVQEILPGISHGMLLELRFLVAEELRNLGTALNR